MVIKNILFNMDGFLRQEYFSLHEWFAEIVSYIHLNFLIYLCQIPNLKMLSTRTYYLVIKLNKSFKAGAMWHIQDLQMVGVMVVRFFKLVVHWLDCCN